ncbi:hypothetical protein DPMN_143354 [Dreissena polymorpha]|uniref:Uncharacterized protein n=1 Tax=Dreissena polymorpha TaxID=45954 RepID=A0A9D4GG29_DREPO|nr:hypothetical protein DPMN_143354 [Dreissena polymorpha]
MATVAKEPSCPTCSRYDFDEKLLERVLRNELAIETMLKEIRETNAKVEATLHLMHDDRKKLEGILDSLDDMESKISEAVSDLTQNASMTISQIKKENAILKGIT